MDLFGRRAHDEQLRKEVAAATRRELTSALAGLPPFITERVTEWYRSLVTGTQQAVNQWFATRTEDQQRILHERFERQEDLLLKRLSIATIQKLAESHRQALIKSIGTKGKDLFTASMQRRSAELLLGVMEEVEKSRGIINSGDEALPNGTRFFFRTANGSRLYVIEQPPAVRTVRFAGYNGNDTSYRPYRLAFPFLVFIVHFNPVGDFCGLYAFFRNERLRSIKDVLCAPALPNIDSGGGVCFPGLNGLDRNLAVAEKAERALDSFWGSGFNRDLRDTFVASMQRINEIRSLEDWQRNTAKDPQFVLTLGWSSRGGTLEAVVRSISARGDESQNPDGDQLRHISEPLNRAAERVGEDLMESALQLIPGWKIDKVTSEVLTSELQKLFLEGAEGLRGMVAESAREIFAEIPNLDRVVEQSERLKTRFAQEVDGRIKWIGLLQDTSSKGPTTDLRSWRSQ